MFRSNLLDIRRRYDKRGACLRDYNVCVPTHLMQPCGNIFVPGFTNKAVRWPLLHRRRSDEATTVHHYAVSSLRRLVVTTVDCFFTVWLASTRVKKMSHWIFFLATNE